MKNRILVAVIAALVLGVVALILLRGQANSPRRDNVTSTASTPVETASAHNHAARVPAYQNASQINELPPTLPPAQFVGKARTAYQVAKEIPKTLAQLPCYCECDEAFGHKSLQSCFVDDHASQCAVCVDEALLAYKLQKEDKLTPEQVREKIIEKFSASH